jgi:hypothetical protein
MYGIELYCVVLCCVVLLSVALQRVIYAEHVYFRIRPQYCSHALGIHYI